ncbi:MAG TPA: hypothetical protein VGD94_23350 [Vicinamibacterales bacterium]
MQAGFGWSFYGFFVCAALWLVLYFAWAAVADRRERDREEP